MKSTGSLSNMQKPAHEVPELKTLSPEESDGWGGEVSESPARLRLVGTHTVCSEQRHGSSSGSSQPCQGHRQHSPGTSPGPDVQRDSPAGVQGHAGLTHSRDRPAQACATRAVLLLYQIHYSESSKLTGTFKSTFCVEGIDTNERLKPKEEKQVFLNDLAIFSYIYIFFTDRHYFSLTENLYIS